MTTTNTLNVKDIIHQDFALMPSTGDIIFENIRDSLQKSAPTIVDFRDLTYMTTAFLNAAIGQLYFTFTSDQLNKFLEIRVNPADVPTLRDVIENAKQYFKDRSGFNNSLSDTITDE